MTKFILKKDLPLAKAGTEVDINTNGFIARIEMDCIMLISIPQKDLDSWVEKKKPKKRERVAVGQMYYYVSDGGIVSSSMEQNDSTDRARYISGNYYNTVNEPEKVRDKQEAIRFITTLVNHMNGDWKPIWNNEQQIKHNLYFYPLSNRYEVSNTYYIKSALSMPYAKQGVYEEIIANHKDKLDLIFDI